MASKKKKDDAAEEKGGGKGKKIGIGAVLAIVLFVAGGKVMGGGSAPAGAAAPTTTVPGPVIALNSMTLNLADGHLLKVGVALQTSSEAGGGGEGSAPAKDDPTKGYAKALDIIISDLGSKTMDELAKPAGKTAAKEELAKELGEAYEGEITGVYFHEFVMQ